MVGSILLHVAVKLPDIVYGLQTKVADGDVLTEIPWNENPALAQQRRPAPAAGHPRPVPARRADRSRRRDRRGRGHLGRPDADPAGTARAAGGPPAQSRSPGGSGQPHRRPGQGRRGAATAADWTLQVDGPRPYALSLADLEALAGYEARLPITCVEGWSVNAHWRGLRCSTSSERAGGTADSRVQFHSVETEGYNHSEMFGPQLAAAVLATHLNGERLNLDHGYPLRLIAPEPARRAQHQVAHPDRGAVMGRWRIVLAVGRDRARAVRGRPAAHPDPGAQPGRAGRLADRRPGHPRRHRVAAGSRRGRAASAGCRPAAVATCRPG